MHVFLPTQTERLRMAVTWLSVLIVSHFSLVCANFICPQVDARLNVEARFFYQRRLNACAWLLPCSLSWLSPIFSSVCVVTLPFASRMVVTVLVTRLPFCIVVVVCTKTKVSWSNLCQFLSRMHVLQRPVKNI